MTDDPIIHGDSTLPVLRSEFCSLIVTSPPYNLGKPYGDDPDSDARAYAEYLKFTRAWLSNAYFYSRGFGRMCVNIALDTSVGGKRPLAVDFITQAMKCGWKYRSTIVWVNGNGNTPNRTAWGSWKSASAPNIITPVETIIVLYKNEWKLSMGMNPPESDITADEFKEWVLGLWNITGESAKRIGHPAPFPRELARRCIKLFSFPGSVVVDPFAGSGTTVIEALIHGREAVGIEKEKRYVELARSRIERECGKIFLDGAK